MSTLKPDRRAKASVVLLAILAMFGALLAASLPASADTAGNQVVTTATTPTQTNVAPNGPLTGLRNKDVVTINATATGVSNNLIFGIDARLCRSGINISLSAQYTASSGNCIATPLATATSAFVQKTIGSPNTSGSINFIVPQGSETVATHAGPGAPIVCNSANPCSLWVHESVPTSIIASGNAYLHYDLTFAAPTAPTAPTASLTAGGALLSWTASTDDAGAGPLSYTVTSSPGGLTCTTSATSCTVAGLEPATAYTFTVVATNAGGSASPASVATSPPVTTAGAAAPVITSAVAGNGKVTVSWAAASPAPTSYTVTSKQGTTNGPSCTTATTSCAVTGLTNGLGYKFVVTANYASSTTASASSGTVIPKVFADLVASNGVPVALTVPRSGSFTAVEGITNNGPDASLATMTISVATGAETAISTDAGLTCGSTVADVAGTGFTQVCTTDAPLASGATLNANVTVAPQASPSLTTVKVTNAVTFPASAPVAYSDSVANNNKVIKTLKVIDSADLSATLIGTSSVGRTGSYVANGTLTNNGTDPVFAKVTIPVAYATETGFTADAGLTCLAPVANMAGTGYTRSCHSTAPLASGASLHLQLTLSPSTNPTKHGLTVGATAAKFSGNVVDAVTTNNKASLKVAITDSGDLSTTIGSAASSVARASTVTLSGTITNNGPDAIGGKTTIAVVGGTIQSSSSDAGLTCVGIGAKTTCTIVGTVPAGTTLNFSIVVLPSTKTTVTSLSATSTTSVLGGITVSDPNSGNNVASKTVAIV